MQIEIIDEPIQFRLFGKSTKVENKCFGEIGFQLMNEIWRVVKEAKIKNTGINHLVYLPDERLFVGVELTDLQQTLLPQTLEPLEIEVQRYAKHLHVGPYSGLPQKWAALKAELKACGETVGCPSLEVYGHSCDDPTKSETTILIGLKPNAH